jgi:hypothetical protein
MIHQTIEEITEMYRTEHPNWSVEICKKQAEIIYKELHRSDAQMRRSDKKYYAHNVPLNQYGTSKGEYNYPFFEDTTDEDLIDEL